MSTTKQKTWIDNITLWKTMFVLKEDMPFLGCKGDIYFAVDFAVDTEDKEMKFVIGYPTFNGRHLGKGVGSFIATKNYLLEHFDFIEKTFSEYESERQSSELDRA